jgi:hypothetical protein
MRKKAPPALLLQDADDVCSAGTRRVSVAVAAASDSDTRPAGFVSALSHEDHDHEDDGEEFGMCFTPHAPAEGGKVNAIMMRKLGKGKSLKRLEEVILMVAAAHPADVDSGGW